MRASMIGSLYNAATHWWKCSCNQCLICLMQGHAHTALHVVLHTNCTKKCNKHETVILTMVVVTAMWGSSANGDACLWVTIV